MVRTSVPELKRYMDKRLSLQLNGDRRVVGVLRGFDPFMNLVLEDCHEDRSAIKPPVQPPTESLGLAIIRGNSVVMVECLDRVA